MDFGTMLDDTFAYTKQGVFENADRWPKLILAIICLGIPMNGYVMRVYRGIQPAPEVDNWGSLFVDGLKLLMVTLGYAIPVFILYITIYGSMFLAALSGRTGHVYPGMVSGWAPNSGFIGLLFLIEIAVGLIIPVASIRFARTNSFSEAFNIPAIIKYIGKIGWINYIIALILITLVIAIPIAILVFGFILLAGIVFFLFKVSTIAILGFVIALLIIILTLAPLFVVFQARYMTRLYDSAKTQQ
jgi:hypothetical protein